MDYSPSYPFVISSRTVSRPSSTSKTSTFFLHAFLPFLDGCFVVAGAPRAFATFAEAMVALEGDGFDAARCGIPKVAKLENLQSGFSGTCIGLYRFGTRRQRRVHRF